LWLSDWVTEWVSVCVCVCVCVCVGVWGVIIRESKYTAKMRGMGGGGEDVHMVER
jgi:hypothetical protein